MKKTRHQDQLESGSPASARNRGGKRLFWIFSGEHVEPPSIRTDVSEEGGRLDEWIFLRDA